MLAAHVHFEAATDPHQYKRLIHASATTSDRSLPCECPEAGDDPADQFPCSDPQCRRLSGSVSVLVADDQRLVREAIAADLSAHPSITVIDHVSDAEAAVARSLDLKPDVLILDVNMPGRSVFDASAELHRVLPKTRILFLTGHFSDSAIEQALASHGIGVVTKDSGTECLVTAVRTVSSGKMFFDDHVLARLVIGPDGPRLRRASPSELGTLSARERAVLRYIAAGMTKRDMADTMHLSVKTIENHTTSLMDKTGLRDRVELTRFAIRNGVVSP